MKCKECESALTNPRALYCNDKCRMAFKRRMSPEQVHKDLPEQNMSPEQVENTTRTGLDGVMFDELYRRVCAYPGVEWKTSPEYKEIMHRLHTLTAGQLELEGQWIPCWKYKQEAAA